MKPIAAVLLALCGLATAAQAATPAEPVARDTRVTATATIAAGTTAPSKTKCIREKEIGSHRTKRVCLPEDQLRQLTPEQRTDLIRSERPPAELIGD